MKLSYIILISLFSLHSYADDNYVYCEGKIEDWDITRTGYVYLDGDWNNSNASQRICKVNGEFDGVDAEVCKVWISAIITANTTKQNVKIKYEGFNSCDSNILGTWQDTVKAPEYIRLY